MNFFSKILYVYPNFFKLRTAIYCLLLILAVLFELISIGIILPVVSSIISAEAKILNFDFIPYFEILSNFTQLDLVTSVLFLLFLVFVFKTLFFLYLAWFEQSYLEKISNSLSSYFFEKYLKLDYSIHLKKSSPELIRNVTTEVQIFVRNVILPILYIITDFLILIGIIFLIVLVEPKGSIYLSIMYMLFGLIFILGFKKKLSDLALSRQIYDQKRIKSYINAFHGIKTIKIFNKEIQFLGDFVNYNSALNRIGKLTGFIVKIPKQMIELITISSFILLTIILLSKESDVLAIFPKLAIFVAAAFRLIPSMNRFLHHYQAIKIGHPSVNKLYDERILLEKKISHQKDTNSIGDFNEIKFNDISFSFNSEKKILKNLNFLIKKGENIGIIGKTGEGKTTLLDIILGLLKPTKGEVFINGISLKQVISQWRMRIGYVPQSTFLLDESIKNNITLEFDKNKVNEKNLEYAINYSQVSEFSKTLVNGINTVIGDRGVRISGGQQQRIGIARALYKNPDLLVLDESTSSLDIKTEEQIINDVLKLKNTKTLVIVSHRNSTIQKCNKIYELKEMNLVKIK